MKVQFKNKDGSFKKELKIAMVIDDYKMPNKDTWWTRGIGKLPDDFKNYEFDREEIHPGITVNTMTIIRYYKLKSDGNV